MNKRNAFSLFLELFRFRVAPWSEPLGRGLGVGFAAIDGSRHLDGAHDEGVGGWLEPPQPLS